MTKAQTPRGFTIPELMISMGILGLVLSLSVVAFVQVFNHYRVTSNNLNMERTARVAAARVTYEFRQAMPDLSDFPIVQPTPVVEPTFPANGGPTPAPINGVKFYRVAPGTGDIGGDPNAIPKNALGAPSPTYEFVNIYLDAVNHQLDECVQPATQSATPCATPTIIANNIANFQVQPLSSSEYRIDLTAAMSSGQPPTPAPFTISSAVYVQYYP